MFKIILFKAKIVRQILIKLVFNVSKIAKCVMYHLMTQKPLIVVHVILPTILIVILALLAVKIVILALMQLFAKIAPKIFIKLFFKIMIPVLAIKNVLMVHIYINNDIYLILIIL